MAKKTQEKGQGSNRWLVVIIILVIMGFFSTMVAGIFALVLSADFDAAGANVAIIPIKGPIYGDADSGAFSSVTGSQDIIEQLDKAADNPSIKAIILEINSPGGSAVASEEIALKVASLNKTTVAWIREVGASGAYWIASATNHIVANRMSVTGSIGVISSYLEFAGFIERYNVTYQRLVAGERKDMGVPFRELPDDERAILQEKLNIIHGYFIDAVAENRGLDRAKVKNIADGSFFLGSEALGFGLVDELGGRNEAMAYIENTLNITAKAAVYQKKISFLEALAGIVSMQSFSVGEGIGKAVVEARPHSGVEMVA